MSQDPDHQLSRRTFLAGVGLLPVSALLRRTTGEAWPPWASGRAGSAGEATASGLPPRVVGLRSLGGNFRFDPEGILIEPGSDLHWLNMGDFHTTTAFHPDNGKLLPAGGTLRIPEGAEPWHSGTLGLTAGTQFTHHFTVEGVYDYFCQPHYSFGMVGRIVVGGPRGGPAVTQPLPESPPSVRENMPSVEAITGPGGVTFEWTSRLNGVLYQAANGQEPGPFAEAVVQAMRGDDALRGLARGEAWGRLDEALSRFAGSATSGAGYETMAQRADAAKRLLRQIHDAA